MVVHIPDPSSAASAVPKILAEEDRECNKSQSWLPLRMVVLPETAPPK